MRGMLHARGRILLFAFCSGLLLRAQDPSRIQALVARGDLAGARAELENAVQRGKADATTFNLLGIVEAQARNYRAAEGAFRKSIRLAPNAAPVYENLGRLYQEHAAEDPQAVTRAIETYRALLRIEPINEEGNFQLARLLALSGRYPESEVRLGKLPEAARNGPGSLGIMVLDRAGLGDHAASMDAAARLLKHPDLTELDVIPLVRALEGAKAADVAERLLEGLAARGLASAGSLRTLGAIYERSGRLVDAREKFEAGAAGGVSLDLLVDLARVSFKQRDYKGTLGYLAHARDLDPKNPGIHFFFGIASIELSLPLEARNSLRQAISLDASNPYYHYALGAVELQLGHYTEALAELAAYSKAKPDDPRGTLVLGIAYFLAQQDEAAVERLRHAAENPGTAATAHYYLGRLLMRQGEPDKALPEFQQAAAGNPKSPDAWSEMGSAHLEQKRYAEAETALARALHLDPEHYRANLHLLTLYRRTRDPRADAQAEKFKHVREAQFENLKLLMRTVEVRPY